MDNSSHGSATGAIPLHRIAVVRPFAQFLENIGAPVERGFRQTGMPYCALEDVNNYVPSHRFWAFLTHMTRIEGIEDLGFRVGTYYGANSADPKLTKLLLQAPTLYQGLLQASELVNRTITHCQLGVLQPPGSGHAYFFHSPSCEADNPAIEQIGWYGISTLIGMVRVFTGPQWQPSEIGMMTDQAPSHHILEQLPDSRIRPLQKTSYIALENALLSLPPLPCEAATHVAAEPATSLLHYEALSNDFTGSLEQVLNSYIREDDLNVTFAAGLCNTSTRTLQRRLTELGTCYIEVLAHARFHAASQMLKDPRIKINDIAKQLGYSCTAHFSRAFRRIAGVTARMYRQQYTH